MDELIAIFDHLLMTHRSIDIANVEFRRMIDDDPELLSQYRLWCEETGRTERHGFTDYAEEYIERQNNIWETLTDYDAEEH